MRPHVLYVREDFREEIRAASERDEDYQNPILDRNGDVVLAQCKRCGRGEIQLDEHPDCTLFDRKEDQ